MSVLDPAGPGDSPAAGQRLRVQLGPDTAGASPEAAAAARPMPDLPDRCVSLGGSERASGSLQPSLPLHLRGQRVGYEGENKWTCGSNGLLTYPLFPSI